MRALAGFLAILVCLAVSMGCIGVSVERESVSEIAPSESREDTGGGAVIVTGFSESREGPNRYAQVEVAYHNTSGRTLHRIESWCRALDVAGYQLGAELWILDVGAQGPMSPGFKKRGSLQITIDEGPPIDRVACEIRGSR